MKAMGIQKKKLLVNQYLDEIRTYLYDLINNHRIARRVSKIQINMHVNFISSKDTGEIRTYYMWSDNVSIMEGKNTNDIIREIFDSFLYYYQKESINI